MLGYDFGTWPFYSEACIDDIRTLLQTSSPLTAYRANPLVGIGPRRGSHVWRLERNLEKQFKVHHAIALNSGTSALHAGLMALDVHGGEVITSPFTFSATASAILLAGGTPVFVDVDPKTFCITKEGVKNAITEKTKAILPVHLFGGLAPVEGLLDLGFPVIEDACQAVGASSGGRFSGTRGICGAYSFNGAKNVPAGEGGALLTNSDAIEKRARLIVNHGENFGEESPGYNYRMTEIHAILARHGLKELKKRNGERYKLASYLTNEILKLEVPNVELPDFDQHHALYVYPFLYQGNRKRFARKLRKYDIEIGEGYITPHLGKYPAFEKFCSPSLHVVSELSERTLCVLSQVRPPATKKEMKLIALAIAEAA